MGTFILRLVSGVALVASWKENVNSCEKYPHIWGWMGLLPPYMGRFLVIFRGLQ